MADFAKRHHEAIAQAMQTAHPAPHAAIGLAVPEVVTSGAVQQWEKCVWELARQFAVDNPKFNGRLFKAACQPGANVRARS